LYSATNIIVVERITGFVQDLAGSALLLADLASRSGMKGHLVSLLGIGTFDNVDFSIPGPDEAQ
jgi:hypothetical protein